MERERERERDMERCRERERERVEGCRENYKRRDELSFIVSICIVPSQQIRYCNYLFPINKAITAKSANLERIKGFLIL